MSEADLTEVDRAALQLAIDLTLSDDPPDPGCVEQVTAFLKKQPWFEVASFCSYHQQMRRLHLRPWQSPPCNIVYREEAEAILDEGPQPAVNDPSVDVGDSQCARLTITMLDLGVSVFHPDPGQAVSARRHAAAQGRA